MDLLKKLKQTQDLGLQANPVAVPELAHLFDKGQPTLFYIATLSAIEKDRMDENYVKFLERNELGAKDSRDLYRSFVVAYCLSNDTNERQATKDEDLDALVSHIAGMQNKIVGRLFAVCNGANRIYGVDDNLKKSTVAEDQNAKSEDGSGALPSTLGTRRGRPGSNASAQQSTQSSGT